MASGNGGAKAQTRLALAYSQGMGIDRNLKEAVKWFRKAADKGDMEAQTQLGFMYAKGEGLNKSESQAVYWWQKASIQGHRVAQAHLRSDFTWTWCHKKHSDGREVVEQSAEQGYMLAQYNLGVMYAKVMGFKKM